MISLAARDIRHSWGKYVLTGLGLGLLIGVTLTMAGVFRGMVDDAQALEVAGAVTPVPGGVGQMTIPVLLRNALVAAHRNAGLPLAAGAL